MGLTYCGKTSLQVTKAIKQSLVLCVGEGQQMTGSTSDSGQGTPESFGEACSYSQCCSSFSGLHEIQSKFRLAMIHCIGKGGLDNENAVQFLHTLYSLFDEYCVIWKDTIATFFQNIFDDPNIDIPGELLICMQNPLITCWWMIGKLAILYTTYYVVFGKFAQVVINVITTKKKKNVIASNYIRLKQSKWLLSDVFLYHLFVILGSTNTLIGINKQTLVYKKLAT